MRTAALLFAAAAAAMVPGPANAIRAFGGVVAIDGNLDTVFDSNILRLPTGTPLGRGASRDEIRYEPSIAGTFTRPVGRQTILLTALYGRDIYQNNSYLSRNRLQLRGALNYVVGARCNGVVDAALSKRQSGTQNGFGLDANDPNFDPGVDDDSGRRINNRQDATSYGATANCGGGGGGLTFGVNAKRYELRNQAVTRRFADSDTTTYGGYVGLGVLRPGQLQLVGSYTEIRYPNGLVIPGVALPFGRAALDSYRIGLTYSRPIGSRISGTIGGSYLKGVPRGQGQQGYSSPAYNVGLTYTPGPKLTATLNGSRDIVASSSAGALYKVVDAATLTTAYRLTPSITARARGSYQRRNFRQSFATPDEPLPRGRETLTLYGGGISYAPRPLYDVSFDVSRSFRNSTPSIYDYSNTSATISLSVHF